MRVDVPDPNYVVGYLWYKDAKQGISWDANVSSENAGPPFDHVSSLRSGVGWNLQSATGSDNGLVGSHVFESEPLTQTLFLNASRLIQLSLWTISDACTVSNGAVNWFYRMNVDVELWLGERFLGGANEHMGADAWFSFGLPGAQRMFIGIHAEVDRIASGETIKLVITPRDQCPLQFGMSKNQRSTISIPFYSEFDRYFRLPKSDDTDVSPIVAKEAPASDPSSASAAPLILSLSVLVPFGARRPVRVPLLLACLLAGAAVSGCLTGGGSFSAADSTEPTRGRFNATIEGGSGLSSSVGGDLVGTVFDVDRAPVHNAHVSLLGTDSFRDTDKLGRFVFRNLTPGTYQLRIEKPNFRALEAPVKILAGNVTRLEVELASVTAKEDEFRPHRHPYWTSSTKKLAVAGDVTFGEACAQTPAVVPAFGLSVRACSSEDFFLAPGGRIIPGTYAVDVKVSWQGEGPLMENRVGVGFRSNSDIKNDTWMYPRGNGETTRIITNWEMGDNGHQKVTTWEFFLYWPALMSSSPGLLSPVTQVRQMPVYSVEITLHRGVVPLEPAHRDYWAGLNTFPSLVQSACVSGGDVQVGKYSCNWRPTDLVPPETQWLDVQLMAGSSPPENPQWLLFGRPMPGAPEKPFTFVKKEGKNSTYRLVLAPEDADSHYQKVSAWNIRLADPAASDRLMDAAIDFEMTAIAHRDAPPSS